MLAIAVLAACATAPAPTAAAGGEAAFEARIVSVDTDPWAYDGNAVITVSTSATEPVQVQLPARWNLCKAAPPGDVQALKAGDRVHVAGTEVEPGIVVVCERPDHHLRKVE